MSPLFSLTRAQGDVELITDLSITDTRRDGKPVTFTVLRSGDSDEAQPSTIEIEVQ